MTDITVTVFSKPSCVQCDQTKRHLNKRGIPFIEKPIDLDKAKVNGFCQAPIILAAGPNGTEAMFSGYRPDHLDQLKGYFAHEQAS